MLVIFLASVLALLSVVSVWAADTVGDTNRFVTTLAPLAKDPQVQTAVSDRVATVVAERLPLKGPLETGVKSLVGSVTGRVVRSEAFAGVWTDALHTAHASFEKALTGRGASAVTLTDDEVRIDLGPVVAMVKNQLVDQGVPGAGRIPAVDVGFAVYKSSSLDKLKTGFRLLQIAGDWLPVLAVLVGAAGVFLSRNRRRALVAAALGVAAAMLVLGTAVAIFRPYFLDHLPPDISRGAGGAVYDALVRFLRISTRTVGALAVLVALGAYLSGPSPMAVWIRAALSSGVRAVRVVADSAGFRADAVDRFTARHKRWIGIAILVIAAAVFVLWNDPSALVVLWFALGIAVAFAIREFFAPGPGLVRREEVAPRAQQ